MKVKNFFILVFIVTTLIISYQNITFAWWYDWWWIINWSTPGEGAYYSYCNNNWNGMSYITSQEVWPSWTSSCSWWDGINPTCWSWNPNPTLWRTTPQPFVLSWSTDTPSWIKVWSWNCTVSVNWWTCSITISDISLNTTVCTSPAAKIDIINPTGYIIATWTKDDYNWHSWVTISSTWYTRVPNITLTVSWSDQWSWLWLYSIKCNWNTIISWTWTPNSTYNLDLDSQVWCSWEWTKLFKLELSDMVWNSFSGSQSIVYDKTTPSFDAENLLIHAINSYQYITENPLDSTSWIKDYSITWMESWKSDINFINNSTWTFTFSWTNWPSNLWWLWSITSKLKISVEDYAWNTTTKLIDIKRIADDISVWNSIYQSINWWLSSYPIWDNYENWGINITANDRYWNPILPVDWIRSSIIEWNFDNHTSFLNSSNYTDWAIYYSWDWNSPVSNQLWNSKTITYNTLTWKNNNIYTSLIRSLVPTRNSWHPYDTNNYIKFTSSNGLVVSNNDLCSWWYNWWFRCSWLNTNFTSWISDWIMDNKIDWTAIALKDKERGFWPALTITPTREWTVMSDNTWLEVNLEIQNKSTHNNFNLDKVGFDFTFDNNDAAYFSDWQITSANTVNPDFVWASSTNMTSVILPTDKRLSFAIVPTTPINLWTSATINKKVLFKWNSYWIWFGKTWFETYIPHWVPYNYIQNIIDSTSYNAWKIDIWASWTSLWNKIAVKWSIWNNWKNQILNTTEWWSTVVDTSNLSKYTYKTNIKQNVFKLTNWLPKNNSNCNPDISVLNWDIIYYDFTWKSDSIGINWNKWCTVKLSWIGWLLWINWLHTIIINWWNLYINTDMYYANPNTSLLWIIVLRDETNKINWWNIYINPDITNIVWSAYAEWSLISWNWSKLFSMWNTNEWELTKQLLWYWSVYSANTIWWSLNPTKSECIFWTDYYMQNNNKNCSQEESSKYDYALLRRFTLIEWGSWCPSWEAPKKTWTTNEKNAWAWKRECYISDAAWNTNLRTSNKKSALIMEFNPSTLIWSLKWFQN